MSGVVDLRTGIYVHPTCVGRNFVSKTRVLVSTVYDKTKKRYETMVFNATPPWDGNVSFNPKEISVRYYSCREGCSDGARIRSVFSVFYRRLNIFIYLILRLGIYSSCILETGFGTVIASPLYTINHASH